MPTIFTHAAVGLAAARSVYPERTTARLLVSAATLSMLPDADVLPLALGARGDWYETHRGFSHSLLFALGAGLVATLLLFPEARARFPPSGWRLWLFLSAVTASHGILDAFTDGGLGIEFLWPFSANRYFFPWTPIRVAPIAITEFFGKWGIRVLKSEAVWVWFPAGAAVAALEVLRRRRKAA